MSKITTRMGMFEAVQEVNYTPEPAELYFWYSGTHAGLDPKNPYARKRTSVTKVKYRRVS